MNKNGKEYGFWEAYWSDGKPCFKGNYLNGKEHGFWEYYNYNGNLRYKGIFYIN
tara:strand:- start:2314 stop:2475 length:162 start_codon:yes stop_codon:yes gene_type:complete